MACNFCLVFDVALQAVEKILHISPITIRRCFSYCRRQVLLAEQQEIIQECVGAGRYGRQFFYCAYSQ